MGTQVVRRKSRTQVVDFQFTANGETSWSFIAEGDSEIYAVESDNVASYTINGGAVVLPFSLVNGNSYTVAITKTTAAQVADLQLNIWSGIDKTTVINVPDYSDLTIADKLFLVHPDSLTILDNSDIENSAEIVITLPTLPSTDYSWRSVVWLRDNRLLISASTNGVSDRFCAACFMDVLTNVVTDFDGNIDQYTTINNAVGAGSWYEWLDYDYVNDLLYIREAILSNYCFEIDLQNNVNNGRVVSEATYITLQNRLSNSGYFDPIKNKFVGLSYYNFNGETDTVAYLNNATSDATFDRVYGYKHKRDNNNDGRIFTFNRNGGQVIANSVNISSGSSSSWMFDVNNTRSIVANYNNGSPNITINVRLIHWGDYSLAPLNKTYSTIDTGIPVTTHNLMRGYYSGLGNTTYLLFTNTTETANGKIVILDNSKIDAGDTTPVVGLYESDKPIHGMCANRIL